MECKYGLTSRAQERHRELIDTLWNVNYFCANFFVGRIRINRYIMECKYICSNDRNTEYLELIDTLWNVNQLNDVEYDIVINELIDTLWNVNSIVSISVSPVKQELIDTLWNVNFFKESKYVDEEMRINRYIMECK